ncbi:hypothetical protein NEOLEDRAFT_1135897 [Neolentinus lepideus HHB14362 ss-1]|uniref:Uncharacterized protein n=1 Tax=Neolentinus lepideus HHB14362 ss-1 TaxID=1314782 RepID=A0A165RGF7_9AGAM|nr:hypothetical protein NEOLEDRAFT_1135897 [Neolentinus lepideus HHB14362 ss-1]
MKLESARDEGDARNKQRECPKDTLGHAVPPKEAWHQVLIRENLSRCNVRAGSGAYKMTGKSKFVFIASLPGPACSSAAPAFLAV